MKASHLLFVPSPIKTDGDEVPKEAFGFVLEDGVDEDRLPPPRAAIDCVAVEEADAAIVPAASCCQ